MYIVYHTSEYETLIGGNDECAYDPTIEGCTAAAATGLEKLIPDFSNAEEKANADLVVEARADGRDRRQWILRLHETGRFDWTIRGLFETNRRERWRSACQCETGKVKNDAVGWGLHVALVQTVATSSRCSK